MSVSGESSASKWETEDFLYYTVRKGLNVLRFYSHRVVIRMMGEYTSTFTGHIYCINVLLISYYFLPLIQYC
jgi:hypothetical protein